MQALRKALHLVIFAGLLLVCLWPAILNGYPFFGTDTPGYIRYVDVAVAKVTGHPSEWGALTLPVPPSASTSPDPVANGDSNSKVPFAGRSVYYGALLELGNSLGLMWVSALVQAAMLLLAVALILHSTVGFSRLVFTTLVVVLSLTTPLAFFASFMMPDLFAGLMILAAAALLVYGERMTRGLLLTWVILLCAGLLVHSSHVLVAMALLGFSLIGRFVFHASMSSRGLIALAVSLVIAFVGEAAFSVATSKMFGVTPIRPPFLMARLVADGPGAAFLKDHCPQARFAACRFVGRFPIATADMFLWSPDPATGVFTPANNATRRTLADEQYRFAAAVLRYDPIGVTLAALRNTLLQFGMLRVNEFNLDDNDRNILSHKVPIRYVRILEKTKGWADALPVGLMFTVILTVLLTSTLYILKVLARPDHRFRRDDDLRRLAVVIIFGVLVNAFVCGALSEPYDRYQARVVWLIPLLAALMVQRRRRDAMAVPTQAVKPPPH